MLARRGWDHILEVLTGFVENGGDGVWIDILMDQSLRESDVDGIELRRGARSWNFAKNAVYAPDDFRQFAEKGVRTVQERFEKRYGRPALIYANNLMASRFEPGKGGLRRYLESTPDKPKPLDGMCIEDFMGGYEAREWDLWTRSRSVSIPGKACYPCESGYKNWEANVRMLAKASQAGLHAMPLIINAGMKTAIFEALDAATRHEWDLWAYASYLLAVERKGGVTPTLLGVPMFYVKDGKREAGIDPMYRLRIGDPAETKPLENYRIAGTTVFRRRFTKGVVYVNPGPAPQKAEGLELAPQSGHISV
jgi:hypothetical protein